jgi:hypothetical protein
MRDCRACGLDYDEDVFFRTRGYMHTSRWILHCLRADFARQEEASEARAKARDALRRHADRFIKEGLAKVQT